MQQLYLPVAVQRKNKKFDPGEQQLERMLPTALCFFCCNCQVSWKEYEPLYIDTFLLINPQQNHQVRPSERLLVHLPTSDHNRKLATIIFYLAWRDEIQ